MGVLNVQCLSVEIHTTSHVFTSPKGHILKVLSYGINTYNNPWGVGTIHAEANAINNLPPHSNKKKNLKKVNILVIKTSPTGKIGISKPCIKCIMNMMTLPIKRGYIIKDVYYSDYYGNIVKTNLKILSTDDNYHVSRFYKAHNYSLKI